MGRPRLYPDHAARNRAYRQRQRDLTRALSHSLPFRLTDPATGRVVLEVRMGPEGASPEEQFPQLLLYGADEEPAVQVLAAPKGGIVRVWDESAGSWRKL